MSMFFNGKKLAELNGLFKTDETFYPWPPANGDDLHVPISARKIEGYSFLFWLAPNSVNQVSRCYIDGPTLPEAAIWIEKGQGFGTNVSIRVTAVYIKN